MNNEMHPLPTTNPTRKTAGEITHDAAKEVTDVVGDVTKATKQAARHATDSAKELYQTAALRAEETLTTSKDYVRRNPVPVVLGAIAFGAALGFVVMMARRKPTFGERYDNEPLLAVREAILGALAPVTYRVHQGYDSARDGAGRAMDRVQRLGTCHTRDSLSDHIGRIGNNLKFW